MRNRNRSARPGTWRVRPALFLVVALLLAPALVWASGEAEDTADGLRELSLRLNTPAYGSHAPFVLAEKLGWYAEEGLTVTFGEGAGSDTTVALIDGGDDDVGLAGFDAIASLRADGAAVKAVGVIEQRSPFAIITMAGSDITTAAALEGSTVVMDRGDIPLFEAFARTAGIDADAVNTVTLAEQAQSAALANGRIDGILGWTTYHAPEVAVLTGDVQAVLWSDFGFSLYNLGIVASDEMVENEPDVLCAFVETSFRALEYSLENPEEAIEALMEEFPNVNEEIVYGQLVNLGELIRTSNTQGRPLGYMAPEDVAATFQVLQETEALDDVPALDDLVSNICFE